MSQNPGSTESKLLKATEYIQGGNQKDARLLIRDVLAGDQNNVGAWELLFRASYNTQEETFCLERILQLQPDHAWAGKRLAAIQSPEVYSAVYRSRSAGKTPNPKKRRRLSLPLALAGLGFLSVLCLGLLGMTIYQAGYLPFSPANLTATALAMNNASCQAIIEKAMQSSGQYCDQIGSNKACYGNITIQADLAPGATQRFSERGDIIDVNQLQRLSAAPLNLENNEWGIAIFNIMANLPRSLPGETVKLVVFGNTTIDRDTPTLESFYFSSELGKVVCKQVPFDGIMITMPNGTGMSFIINGTQMLLMGNASLTATKNGNMQVSLYSGSGMIEAGGKKQYFSGGESVKVALGGPGGRNVIGQPSAPVPLSSEEKELNCTLTKTSCSSETIPTTGPGAVEATIETGLRITPTASQTPTTTSTRTVTLSPTISPTRYVIPYTTQTPTLLHAITLTRTLTPIRAITSTPTITHTPSITRTPTKTRTATDTRTPTQTRTRTMTPTITATRTVTRTITQTRTLTLTPTRSLTVTASNTPTVTLTPTITDTPSITPTPTLTDTPSTTPTPTITPGTCGSITTTSLSASGTQLKIAITNNFPGVINIQEVDLTWDSSSGTHLKTIQLVGSATVSIWNGNVLSPQAITTFSDSTAIANGSTATLLLDFAPKSAPSGASLTVFFDQGCQVQGSN